LTAEQQQQQQQRSVLHFDSERIARRCVVSEQQ
jgi:hypothetical protein